MIFDEEFNNDRQLSLNFQDDETEFIGKNNTIELQQNTMLKLIFTLLKKELEKHDNKQLIKVRLFDDLNHTDEGYYLLSNLIEKTNFEKIAEKYYLYFYEGEYDHHETFYYEIIWDYDTYIKMSKLNKTNKDDKKEYLKIYKTRKKEYFDSKKY